MSKNMVETLIGAAVLFITIAFVSYGYAVSGEDLGGDNYQVFAEFESVDGLRLGSDVRLAGIKIGAVESLALLDDTYKARLALRINAEVQLPDDSSVKVTSSGLLGEQYLAVVPGGSMDYLQAGDEIMFTQGSVDLIGLVGQAMFNSGGGE